MKKIKPNQYIDEDGDVFQVDYFAPKELVCFSAKRQWADTAPVDKLIYMHIDDVPEIILLFDNLLKTLKDETQPSQVQKSSISIVGDS